MYVSLSELKIYMGISGTDDDTLLTMLLSTGQAKLDKEIGDLTSQERTEQTTFCKFFSSGDGGAEFYANNINVTRLDEINGTAFSGVLGTDYRIIDGYQGRKIWIKDLTPYVSSVLTKYFDIVYTSGYSTIPRDIKELLMKLVQETYSNDDGKNISSFKSGPEQVTYADIKMGITLNSFNSTLQKYKILNVY